MTSPERTFTDLAEHWSARPRRRDKNSVPQGTPGGPQRSHTSPDALVELVILGDAMARKKVVVDERTRRQDYLTTPEQLRVAAQALPTRRRGTAVAKRAADLVRMKVDSPMESRLRLLIILAGLPCPEPNLKIYGRDGFEIGRFDLVYKESKTVLEYDGKDHRIEERKWQFDETKRQELQDHNWRVLTFRARNVFVEPDKSVAHIHQILRERRQPGVPNICNDEWRQYFRSGQAPDPMWPDGPEDEEEPPPGW